jgi:hypothetical protein
LQREIAKSSNNGKKQPGDSWPLRYPAILSFGPALTECFRRHSRRALRRPSGRPFGRPPKAFQTPEPETDERQRERECIAGGCADFSGTSGEASHEHQYKLQAGSVVQTVCAARTSTVHYELVACSANTSLVVQTGTV